MTTSPPTTRLPNGDLLRGVAVARLLREVQSPRGSSPTVRKGVDDNFNLAELTPLLMNSGVGAYGWLHVSESGFVETYFGRELRDAYRQQRLSARRHERDIAAVISLLRTAGIEPVLVKGWAIARHYQDPALRPYGDIDLCVSPAQFAKAGEVLKRIESIDGPFVDLHRGFNRIGVGKRLSFLFSAKTQCPLCLKGKCTRHGFHQRGTEGAEEAQRDWDEMFERTRLERLEVRSQKSAVRGQGSEVSNGDTSRDFSVRVLSDEDHLRILCVHMLRSGARRPAWLCDVAQLLSPKSKVQSPKSVQQKKTLDFGPWTLESSFDWSICLGSDPVHADYVATAVLLAHELLGVDISHTPFADAQLPRWVVAETLEQWGGRSLKRPTSEVQSRGRLRGHWTLDFGHWTNWYRRWDNPIRATAAVNGKYTSRPRLRNRLTELIVRLPEVPDHWRAVRQQFRSQKEQRSEVRDQRSAHWHSTLPERVSQLTGSAGVPARNERSEPVGIQRYRSA